MLVGLSQIRSLLPVQMSQEEEELMRERLWFIFIFYYFDLSKIKNKKYIYYGLVDL